MTVNHQPGKPASLRSSDRKIRVLHVLEATLGGTRRHVIDLLNMFDLDLFEISFCYSTIRADGNFADELKSISERGIRCIEISMVREISLKQDFLSFLALFRIVRQGQFDVVHCHSSKAGFLGRIAAKLASRKTVTIYTPNSMAINIGWLYRYVEKFANLFTDIIIAVSESERAEILGAKVSRKIIAINSGVPPYPKRTRKNLIAEEIRNTKGKTVVVSIGRLTKQKDPLTFFQTANTCINEIRNRSLYFVWIGDGELRPLVEEYISRNHLEHYCSVMGWRTDVEQLLWGAHIFVLTSLYESFGYVTCEAMSHGLPVIATDAVGTTDIVANRETGYVVNKGDSRAIAERVLELVNNPSLRNEMGKKGHARVEENFNVLEMAKKTQNLYLELLAKI